MRFLLIVILAAGAFTLSMTAQSQNAQAAVVCANGVVRAGCVGPNGAVGVRKPVVHSHGAVCRRYGVVGGVRRCVLY